VLLVVIWYAKNLWLVGQFTASTWAGMNLSRITTFCLGPVERERLIRSGAFSEFADYPPFRNPERYLLLLPDTPTTGVPILDLIYTSYRDRNRHHLVYAAASTYYFADALTTLRVRPDAYADCVRIAFLIAFRSPTDYERTLGNRDRIQALDLWWNRLAYGQWEQDIGGTDQGPDFEARHLSLFTIGSYLAVLLGGGYYLWRRRALRREPQYIVALFMQVNVAFTVFGANLVDLGENNRFRYTVDPFVILLLVFYIREWREGGKRRAEPRLAAAGSTMPDSE